jgi:hypothetical protein
MMMQILTIGILAREALQTAPSGTVWGVTGRGAFLRLETGWVIFLSNEPYRGPLTLNVNCSQADLARLAHGMSMICSDPATHRLQIPAACLELDCANAVFWSAPPTRPQAALSAPAQRAYFQTLASLVLAGSSSESTLLGRVLAATLGQPPQAYPAEIAALEPLLQAWRLGQVPATLPISPLLGLGPGLTPSGDDLALGLLLALNRWPAAAAPAVDDLNRAVIEAAGRRTHALSHSLLRAAAQGQADERLVLALDGLLTGELEVTAGAGALRAWGSHSGSDALAGMALALIPAIP